METEVKSPQMSLKKAVIGTFFIKKHTVHREKSRKRIGVTLRYTWITRAMFMGPWSGAHPPIREAILKKMSTYHLDWAPWSLLQKHTVCCVLLFKKMSKWYRFKKIKLYDYNNVEIN